MVTDLFTNVAQHPLIAFFLGVTLIICCHGLAPKVYVNNSNK